jgi:hypothetical protein
MHGSVDITVSKFFLKKTYISYISIPYSVSHQPYTEEAMFGTYSSTYKFVIVDAYM